MNNPELQVEKRMSMGKSVRHLRHDGILPGVVYGKGVESTPIQCTLKDFERVYAEAGESTVVMMALGDKKMPVIIQDVTRDPVSDHVLHVDLYQVRLDQKITATVPFEFINEAPAVKDLGGVLIKNINEIEIEALPQDLPHNIVVDLSSLSSIGSQILLKNVAMSSALNVKADPESVIALVQEPAPEEVTTAAAEVSAEDVEVIKREKKPEEGEEGASE